MRAARSRSPRGIRRDAVQACALLPETLRSRKYSEGQNTLVQGQRRCCMGVACEIPTRRGQPELSFHLGLAGLLEFLNRTSFLPDIVREWVDFATDRDAFRRDAQSRLGHRTLAGANDKSLGFEETAAHIEKVDFHLIPEAGSVPLEGEASRSSNLGAVE